MLTYASGPADAAALMAAHVTLPTIEAAQAALDAAFAGAPGPDPACPDLFTHTVARVRRDLDPDLADLLGLDPRRAPDRDEIVHLLGARCADGRSIPGRTIRRTLQPGLACEIGLRTDRVATAAEVDRIIAGRRGDDGAALPEGRRAPLRARFLALYGLTKQPDVDPLTTAVLDAIRAGRRADGGTLHLPGYLRAINAVPRAIAFLDLVLSADKSLSIAAALAPTQGERTLLLAAHRDAVEETMRVAAGVIGRARRGAGGRGGADLGAIAWLVFEHHAARPTREPGRVGVDAAWVAGDCQLHSHVLIPNVVLTPMGHVGGLDLGALRGRVHEIGALYQASIATRLRELGVAVMLDATTGAARLPAVPENVRAHFSKRTNVGTQAARAYAAAQGEDWDSLGAARRVVRRKAATQDPRGAKVDDCGSVARWRAQAAELGWTPTGVIDLGAPSHKPTENRLAVACRTAAALLERVDRDGSLPEEAALRIAAARGLIAGGYRGADDVDAVVRLLKQRDAVPDADDLHRTDAGRGRRYGQPTPDGAANERLGSEAPAAAVTASGADLLAALRAAGRARLAPGAHADAAMAATLLWEEHWSSDRATDARTLMVAPTEVDARAVGAAVRRRRQVKGRLGPDQLAIAAIDRDGVPFDLPLTVGDTVRLGTRANAGGAGGRGLLGIEGSTLEVVEVGPRGLLLRNAHGRAGHVAWTTLRDQATGRYRLSYGGCTTLALARHAIADEVILALPGGTAACSSGETGAFLRRHAGAVFIVLGEAAERLAMAACRPPEAGHVDVEDLWRYAGERLWRLDEGSRGGDLLARARACRECAMANRRLGHARLELMEGTRGGARRRLQSLADLAFEFGRLGERRVQDCTAYIRQTVNERRELLHNQDATSVSLVPFG